MSTKAIGEEFVQWYGRMGLRVITSQWNDVLIKTQLLWGNHASIICVLQTLMQANKTEQRGKRICG